MMDPGQQPTNSDVRNFPRKPQETARRDSRVGSAQPKIPDDVSREDALLAALEKLRFAEEKLRSRNEELADAIRAKDHLLVAERKAREEAESANQVKADLLALLSHEFRTPLQAIFGYTELLERQIHGPLNEVQLRDVQRIQQSQEHLLGLITTILEGALASG